ncbi:hypothetical protein PAECIP112173_03226 [Paenibacillus sp. JJ-100]|uniref:hypothetical protein n=1 Tax=Paenibacillus sp. JJ-100 TaxID=2974896 RepID=UPI0022FFA938|nr:hypothetical protein [Paenibacillus sp. JJ-100]CAI6081493.1 hypothetical protein PAECIP112173_03226 [Paenibacillus sp. JJ-100]
MVINHRLLLMFITLMILVTGCGGLSQSESDEYYHKAIPIGQEYFKKYYDADVEFNDYQILLPMSSTIVLNGHVKDDPQTWVSLIFHLPSLEIDSEGGPGEFIDKRKSEEKVNYK